MSYLTRTDCVFLLKTCVAPAPSRDFYAIKVAGNQLSLCIWRISHGRRHFPQELKQSLKEFVEDCYMQEEIKELFGLQTVRSIMEIAHGTKHYLPHLPMKTLIKIISSLDLKDIGHFAQVCRKCREITLSNDLWKELFHKYNKMEITYDDRREAVICGWKKLFMKKKLCIASKNEKVNKHTISSRKLSPTGKLEKKSTKLVNSISDNSFNIKQSNSNSECTKKLLRTQKLQLKLNKHTNTSPEYNSQQTRKFKSQKNC